MNEMPTSAPKASATNLNSVSSSNAGLLLPSTLGRESIKYAHHWPLDEDDRRPGHGHPQHNRAVSYRSAPNAYPEGKVPDSVSLPIVGEPAGRLPIS